MRFATVILSALLCLNAFAESAAKSEANDDEIVAAAEKLVSEAKSEAATTAPAVAAAAANETAPTAAAEGKKESEIPVFTKSEKVAKSESSLVWRLIGSLAFIAVVGGALIFAGRRWKSEKNKGGEKARVEMLHQFHLGPKRSVALIRVAGEALLIGCTDHSVNFLKSITLIDDELEHVMNKDFNGFLDDEFSVEDVRTALQQRA
jgi:flagellar protein FliO/FliZ